MARCCGNNGGVRDAGAEAARQPGARPPSQPARSAVRRTDPACAAPRRLARTSRTLAGSRPGMIALVGPDVLSAPH
eukprot:592981-Rhodomonas_salina.2